MSDTILGKNVKGTYGTMYFVSDMHRSVEWFKAIGLKATLETPEWTEFTVDNHLVCLHPIDDKKKGVPAGYLIIDVNNLKGIVQDLKQRGIKMESEIKEVCPGSFAISLYDPDGNVVSLFERQS